MRGGGGKKGGNLNAPIFKSLNTRGKGSLGKEGGRSGRKGVAREGRGSLGKEAGRLRGGVPERGEIPGEGGSPGGKLRLRIDRRKKERIGIPPNL